MKFIRFRHVFFFLFISGLSICFTNCGITRKAQAAGIIRQCKPEIRTVQLDSVIISPDLFKKLKASSAGILPNPQVILFIQNLSKGIIDSSLGDAFLSVTLNLQNKSKDSLWLRDFQAQLHLDTLLTLPLDSHDSVLLVPGENTVTLHTSLPLDKKIFSVPSVRTLRIQGLLKVALDADDDDVLFEFDESKVVTPEEMNALLQKARDAAVNGLVDDWVRKLL